MSLPKHYVPAEAEPRLQSLWKQAGIHDFSPQSERPVFSIDSPPPTVSGTLHLGHMFSYTQTDVIARYRRMRGDNVFYPMGFDDNGLPTERLVEKLLGADSREFDRRIFVARCLEVSQEYEIEYQSLWRRMGLSVDWRHTYRTIDDRAQRIAQWSFIDLYQKNLVYRERAPSIWCPECQTAVAQADLDDLERESELIVLDFRIENGDSLAIATTRPELLPACVAVFVHPGDPRYQDLVGLKATVPLFGRPVPILEDRAAHPQKGTGAVMCCTFGDTTDKQWWYTHDLPLIEAIARDGTMTSAAGDLAGLPTSAARRRIKTALEARGLLMDRQPTIQVIRVHERCDTPVEYLMTHQWFIRVLAFKEELLQAGQRILWQPPHMQARYRSWVENLAWDWCISRQRYFGVPFPLWYCRSCGEIMAADLEHLPVDPSKDHPSALCSCGSDEFMPEEDVMDTWAISSMTPQIVGEWQLGKQPETGQPYSLVFPFSLRPQAQEIIRTWAFYTLVKSLYHFRQIPWKEIAISGWGLAGDGMGKISKSRGGGPMSPRQAIERYSADAIRYWASSTALGKDTVISIEKFESGTRLVTKLWNVARFSERFLKDYQPPEVPGAGAPLLPPDLLSSADRWILSRTQRLIRRATVLFEAYDYAAAKNEIEAFFWNELADNYLEMCKQRLYDEENPSREGAQFSLYRTVRTIIQLLAPILPHVTDEIFLGLFAEKEGAISVHRMPWPAPLGTLEDDLADAAGAILVAAATTVRRYKSERNLPLNTTVKKIEIQVDDPDLEARLRQAKADLSSVTRAEAIEVVDSFDPALQVLEIEGTARIAIAHQHNVG